MTRLFTLFAAIAICAGVLTQSAAAGTISWGIEVVSAFDPTTFDPVSIPDITMNQGAPVGLELGISFTPTPGAGERDFLNFAADIGLSGDITDPAFGYVAQPSPMVDTSPAPGDQLGPVFPTNQDAGAADLQDIVLSKTAPLSDTDNRTTFSGYPVNFGNVFLVWGGTEAQVTISGEASFNTPGGTMQPAAVPFTPFVFDLGGDEGGVTGDPPSGSTISMQGAFDDGTGVAEQAIMVMGGTISDLVISGETIPGIYSAVQNSQDSSKIDIMMDLDLAKSQPRGALAEGTLTVMTSGGNLTYTLSARVPEPSSVALASLALVGVIGFVARRK